MRVLAQREEQALLKAYIVEWRKFFTQSGYLPLPFRQLESGLQVSITLICTQTASNTTKTSIDRSPQFAEQIIRTERLKLGT